MIKGGILKLLVVVMLLVQGSFSCKRDSGNQGNGDSTSVDSTMAPPLYNCTFENTTSYTSTATVRNITNTTEILCQAFVDVSGDLEYPNRSRADERAFCNHLGGTVCPNCTNNTLYEDFVQNITTSCAKEETTTMFATTDDFSTRPRTTEATTNKQNSTKVETTIIIAVVAGIVLLVLLAVVMFFMCKRKRIPKESKANIQNGPTKQVVRLETNETGDLDTVLDRGQNGAGVVTNVGPLYDAVHDAEGVENSALYTEVNINGGRNGASSRPGQPTEVEDTQLYNVLHQPGSAHENDALYSVLNAER